MILTKLDIPKRQAQCSGGDHFFQKGDRCYTLVTLSAATWKRQDLCQHCWNKLCEEELSDQVRSYWNTQITGKEPEAEQPKHKEGRALALLKEALLTRSATSEQEAFVLALYLARKKSLSLRQQVEQLGETIYLFESTATEELIPVKKVTINPDQVAVLQQRLAEMLKTDT